ncbi:MAG: hypothetical protein OEZ01_17275 [Candidatus Heimdallarchaeota archaeon]|nr:hypothetical protein [Candidatus Heimdallarchaeota archaeon]
MAKENKKRESLQCYTTQKSNGLDNLFTIEQSKLSKWEVLKPDKGEIIIFFIAVVFAYFRPIWIFLFISPSKALVNFQELRLTYTGFWMLFLYNMRYLYSSPITDQSVREKHAEKFSDLKINEIVTIRLIGFIASFILIILGLVLHY